MHWSPSFLAAFLLLCLSTSCGATFAPSMLDSPSATLHVKVMSYNVLQFPPTLGHNDEVQRLQQLVHFINSAKRHERVPDVIAVQELWSEESRDFLERNIKSLFPYNTKVLASECPPTGWDSHTGPCSQST